MRYQGRYDGTAVRWRHWPAVRAPEQPEPPRWACSLFAALADETTMLYGRNFDWRFSPGLLLFTEPPDGYASVSMVDIEYLGFGPPTSQKLTGLTHADLQGLLYAPFIPFDGMNETGLVVGMAAVPPGGMHPDPAMETIDSVAVIREILDHASTVDEAVAILQSYNIEWGSGPPLHYLVADRSGHSVLVEFYQGDIHLLPNEHPWHLATNFLVSAVPDSGQGQCWRYDQIQDSLAENGGRLYLPAAMELLAKVAQENTQWSVVYGLSSGQIDIVMGQKYDDRHTFQLGQSAPAATESSVSLRMVTVYDNTSFQSGLRADWGFAAWLEYGGHVVLFDTGANGRILLGNLEKLGLDPRRIEAIVLSHEHGDHTGGLDALLGLGIKPPVYALGSFPQAMKQELRTRTELIEIGEPVEILPGMYSAGEIRGAVREQGLVIETAGGLVIVTGCAHPGIIRMIESALEVVEGDIALVVGGFHLGQAGESSVRRTVAGFRELGVRQVSPTHCTGEAAIALFADEYGQDYIPGGAGQVYQVGAASQRLEP